MIGQMSTMQVAISEPPPATIAASVTTAAATSSWHDSAPRDLAWGRLAFEPFMTSAPDGEQHKGGRFGVDMLVATGDRPTRLASGIRLLLGGDGGGHFGPEGALSIGVAHAFDADTVASLVVPFGFAMTFDGPEELGVHGVYGLEGSMLARGLDLGAGISNRGYRGHAGYARRGRESGFGVGIEWQRDAGIDLLGVYVASTPGRR